MRRLEIETYKKSYMRWGNELGGRKLLENHLAELELRPAEKVERKAEKGEKKVGFPVGFGFSKKKIGYYAGVYAQRVLEKMTPEELEETCRMPVDFETRKLVYYKGRLAYLRERNKLNPWERFKYPIVSSWEHGGFYNFYRSGKRFSSATNLGRKDSIKNETKGQKGVFHPDLSI